MNTERLREIKICRWQPIKFDIWNHRNHNVIGKHNKRDCISEQCCCGFAWVIGSSIKLTFDFKWDIFHKSLFALLHRQSLQESGSPINNHQQFAIAKASWMSSLWQRSPHHQMYLPLVTYSILAKWLFASPPYMGQEER